MLLGYVCYDQPFQDGWTLHQQALKLKLSYYVPLVAEVQLHVPCNVRVCMVQVTFDHFQVVGDLLQDGKAGQDQAEGAAQAWPRAALRLVPLAALQQLVPTVTNPNHGQHPHVFKTFLVSVL